MKKKPRLEIQTYIPGESEFFSFKLICREMLAKKLLDWEGKSGKKKILPVLISFTGKTNK